MMKNSQIENQNMNEKKYKNVKIPKLNIKPLKPVKTKGIFYNSKNTGGMRTKATIKKVVIYTLLTIVSILWILPFVYLILQSFAVSYESTAIIPRQWTLNNYRALFDTNYIMMFNGKEMCFAQTYPFGRWMINTFCIAVATAILQTIFTLMSSYAFSRLSFPSRKKYMKLILIIGMFPGFLGMIINYFMLGQIRIGDYSLNSGYLGLVGLIIIYTSGSIMNYYVSKGFFDTISKSLDEAAMIDGANKNTIFWKVILPLSKPIIVYTVLLAFTAPWGDYMFASVIAMGNSKIFNVAVGLQQLLSKETGTNGFPIFCAAGVIIAIPITTLFFFLQKYYVEGVTGGSVKG